MNVRAYKTGDLEQMLAIWNSIVEDGIAFPQDSCMNLTEARDFFGEQSYCGVVEENDQLLGLYILHPNNVGRCAHIANASYAVKKDCRGKHIGEALVRDSIKMASELSFRVLQFNAVVATNKAAIHLYQKLGFTALGVIPNGFKMADDSYEDIIPYYIEV